MHILNTLMTRVHGKASTLAPDTLYVTAGDQNLQPDDVRDSLHSAEVDEGASMHIYTPPPKRAS